MINALRVYPTCAMNQLYKYTQLEDTFSVIMLALVNQTDPKVLNLKQVLEHYVKFQEEVITRRTKFDKAKAEARVHILEGLKIALDNIDEVIETIRNSYNDAKEKLMNRFSLTDIQAQAILDMRLARLAGMEREKIDKEYDELVKLIAHLTEILSDESLVLGIVKDELSAILRTLSPKRIT